MSVRCSAIVLTGGTSRRFGSDKSQALLSNYSLLDEILLALPLTLPVVVVGPDPGRATRPIVVTQEEPAFGGPVAGIAAGLEIVETELVIVMATDMPFVAPMLLRLIEELAEGFDVVMPVDAKGFRQPLSAIYRVESLRKALPILGDPRGQSMRNLVTLLNVQEILVDERFENELLDIDTQKDLDRAVAFIQQKQDNPINERR